MTEWRVNDQLTLQAGRWYKATNMIDVMALKVELVQGMPGVETLRITYLYRDWGTFQFSESAGYFIDRVRGMLFGGTVIE